ncbi:MULTISPECIES: nuclease-related domain-containing protein [unclassified Lysinibacillus]|uniref:nuclease-related domain-containing protein n=1 Tax=unclassified Lysinibacillus TaxID=2636778 RepID=UPI001483C394|nr:MULTISPECIES: nuclease-related domain-containing protein [unclassified Lysinibacillus]
MLLKKREVSSKQRVLEMIERRLPKSHAKYYYFQEMLGRTRAGIVGEQRVDREWREIYLEHTYYLLHDVELKAESAAGSTHQMDTLFMSQHFVLIVEIKNIVGRVEYMEDKHQFIRITSDDKVDGFRNPFDQVKRHARMLRRLFQMSGHHIPIEYIVVSSNPNMIMTSSLSAQPIIHVSGLAERIDQLFKQHQQVCLSEKNLREISEHILKMHTPTQWTLDIMVDELKTGALCSQCHFDHILRYTHGKWFCSNCQSIDNQSMLIALHDFRLMLSNNITNAQFRKFFDIDSEKAVYYLLKKLKFEEIGENKNRKYVIPANLLE